MEFPFGCLFSMLFLFYGLGKSMCKKYICIVYRTLYTYVFTLYIYASLMYAS